MFEYPPDVHQHSGTQPGLAIALEGLPNYPGTHTNTSLTAHSNRKDFFTVRYIQNHEIGQQQFVGEHLGVKYHARREKYSPDEVAGHLAQGNVKFAILDTLNWPYWQPSDYFDLVLEFPAVVFLLAHSGGIQIGDFMPGLMFSNCYFDFSMTSVFFGLDDQDSPRYSQQVFEACSTLSRHPMTRNRLLFGSDEPFFSRELTQQAYLNVGATGEQLRQNYGQMINKIRKSNEK